MLDGLIDATILRLEGPESLELVSEIRAAAAALRAKPSIEEAHRLRDRLASLELPALRMLTRALSLHFDLINLAEQQTRVRTLRPGRTAHPRPLGETTEAALEQLAERGVTAEQLGEVLGRAQVVPVFTAHPSEARRRTILEKLDRIAGHLDRLEYARLLPGEQAEALAEIAAEIESFWLSDIVRDSRPCVADEIRQGLGMVSETLFEVVTRLYRNFEGSLARTFPDFKGRVPSLLRFGTWIGGDRDGNPHVTPEVTAEAVRMQQELVLGHYLERVVELGQRLSHSRNWLRPGVKLLASLAADGDELPEVREATDREPYRQKCRYIEERLRRTLAFAGSTVPDWSRECVELPPGVYRSASQLRDDLALIADDFERRSAGHVTETLVRDLVRQVEVFGFRMLSLDVRQHSAARPGAGRDLPLGRRQRSLLEAVAQRAIRAA